MRLWQPFPTRADRPETPRAQPKSGAQPRARRSRPLGCLGKYRLLELIGSGAMGAVYRAEHMVLGRIVAVKVLHSDLAKDKTLVERFFAEARAVNLVGHPHIVDVTDFAREPDGTVWFVMEFLNGCDLAFLADGKPLELGRALAIGQQICAALQAVHAVGIVHRDIKPENIYVTERDGRDFVKLLDFGIARLPERVFSEKGTGRGVVMGTPPYMAPEQACAQDVDHRSDLYAVGAVLFALITGQMVFKRDSIQELLEDVAFTPAPAPSSLVQLPESLRDAIDALLARCLAKAPKDRPQSAAELGAELAALAERLEGAHQPVAHALAVAPLPAPQASSQPAPAAPEPAPAPKHDALALVPSTTELDADEVEPVAVLARCRPKWQQRALWIAAVSLLATGVVRAAPRFFPQLNHYREQAAQTLGDVGGVNVIDGRSPAAAITEPRAAHAPVGSRAPTAESRAAVPPPPAAALPPPPAISPQELSAVVIPVQRAGADIPEGADAPPVTSTADTDQERPRSRRARSDRTEAPAPDAVQVEHPVLTVAAVREHEDLDPDKLLDPFSAH